jgi:hypothetical protein
LHSMLNQLNLLKANSSLKVLDVIVLQLAWDRRA